MLGWLEDVAGPSFVSAVLWTLLALVLLVIVLVIVRLVRSLTFGTFVVGGRNRKTRLAVMDATAVDSHRRLVLVRRDDVEHLILIGGPTDVVVEQHIRHGQQRRPAAPQEQPQQHQHEPPPQPRPAPAEPAPAQRAPQQRQQRPPEPRYVEPAPEPSYAPSYAEFRPEPAPVRAPAPFVEARGPSSRLPSARMDPPVAPSGRDAYLPRDLQASPQSQRAKSTSGDIDKALLDELTVSLDTAKAKKAPKPAEVSLEDEMNKLLGELSNGKR